jgi:probable HAF family extracellular repeat protein
MKSTRLKGVKAIALTVFSLLVIQSQLAAQDNHENRDKHHHYQLIDLGTFGGPSSYLAGSNGTNGAVNQILNNQGTVVGWGDTSTLDPFAPNCLLQFSPDCFLPFAFQWRKGVRTDLGVLPGGDASVAVWISDNGLIAGQATNGLADPLVPSFPEIRAVLWKDGQIINLGTLGGNQSFALSVNNRGQVVGVATNTIPDPFDFLFVTQLRAFLWQEGAIQDLGTLGGPEAQALFVNERGQVAGFSLTNATVNPTTGSPTTDPFLWENGEMLDLGTLGGTSGSPFGLNNRGQVVGLSNLAGDQTAHPFLWDKGTLRDLGTLGGSFGIAEGINDSGEVVGAAIKKDQAVFSPLAFLWKDGVMTNLGTLNGDDCSWAFHINSKGQIVGISYPCANPVFPNFHGFLWQNGFMTDLNAFAPPDSSLATWGDGIFINDRGEIAGLRVLPPFQPALDLHAFLLVPCDENHQDIEDCDFSEVEGSDSAIRVGSPPVEQGPTNANPWVSGAANPMMRYFGHRTMPWYRNLGVQTQPK